MKHTHRTVATIAFILTLVLAGCRSLPFEDAESLVGALGADEPAPAEPDRPDVEVFQVAAGRAMSFAVDADGGRRAVALGSNDNNVLGLGPVNEGQRVSRPRQVGGW